MTEADELNPPPWGVQQQCREAGLAPISLHCWKRMFTLC